MLYIIWIVCLLLGCEQTVQQPPANSPLLARVGRTCFLYQEDIAGLVPSSTSGPDSLVLVNDYLRTWVLKNLLVEEAKKKLPKEVILKNIEKQVADFRSSLLMHYYLETTAQTQVDTVVSPEEITKYYQEHQQRFKLDRDIVRGKFIILPKRASQPRPIKNWMVAEKPSDQVALEEYCKEFAKDYSLDTSCWLDWNQMIGSTVLANMPDHARLLKQNSFTEMQDENYKYYLKVDAHKRINDVAPLPFVIEEIKKLVIYKRKIAFINQLKEDILQQATANNEYTIYANK
jgi:hypothetical protein